MNYEQKYKDALERARNLHKDAIDMGESLRAKQCEIIFPELGESEDECVEKIKKDIISYLNNRQITSIAEISATEKWLVWLEKQGKTNVAQTVSHDYVEIGGVKWATKNVGANAITDYGLYFQWGDTQSYTTAQVPSEKAFRMDDYKWTEDRGDTFTKYNMTDGKTIIYSEDDAVTAAWGDKWRMPTHEEYQALYKATTHEWTTMNGVAGILFTSKEDPSKALFFPAAGYCGDGSVWYVGSCGYYWSLSLAAGNMCNAWYMSFGYGSIYPDLTNFRYYGYSVRGVMNC